MLKDFHDHAESLGRMMFRNGKGVRDNPYRKGTYSHQRWERGYQSAANGQLFDHGDVSDDSEPIWID